MSNEHLWYKQRLRLGLTIHWICVVIYFGVLSFLGLESERSSLTSYWVLGLYIFAAAIIKELLMHLRGGTIERFYWAFSLIDIFVVTYVYYQCYPLNSVVFPFYLLIILKSTIETVPGEMRNTAIACFFGLIVDHVLLWTKYRAGADLSSLQGMASLLAPCIYLCVIVFFAMIAEKVRGIRKEMTDRLNTALKEKETHLTELISAHVALEEKYVESYTLNLVQESIFQQLDRMRIMENASDILMGVLGGKSCSIYLNLLKEDFLRMMVGTGVLDEECFKPEYSIHDSALIPTTWRQDGICDERNMDSKEREALKKSGIHSVLCVPLTGQDHMWGVILLTHALEDAFPQERRSLVQLIARQLGLALDNARLHQEMKELATHDPLTGLYNRHFLNNYLDEVNEQIISAALEHVSCVVMDIDHFKIINDTYGHLFGDLILQQVTGVIRRLAKHEIIARYGGEEFIILANDEAEAIYNLAEAIRCEVEKSSFGSTQKGFISVTLSCGVASIPGDARNATELLAMADAALYKAKRSGRNQTVLFGALGYEDSPDSADEVL